MNSTVLGFWGKINHFWIEYRISFGINHSFGITNIYQNDAGRHNAILDSHK